MKSMLIGLSAMAMLGGIATAVADQCVEQEFTTSFDNAGPVSVDGFPENFCYKFSAVGDINGDYISCILPDNKGEKFTVGPPSHASIFAIGPSKRPKWTHEIEGLGEISDVYSIYWEEWIETTNGRLHMHAYGVTDIYGSGSTAQLNKVMPDSEGEFAGATGELFVLSNGGSGEIQITGNICTPD